ncbi:hypothetical protein SCHPADRAFT_595212 [Schizopora paradoxa]|uniref:FAD/NAD(P)-binding domain-containing protein n=1 Tax=Schizopora paradoxa TaxID=27342 RepID=A0A0H2RGW2_9AGAM|nr:hypothetical protein SCHPADRAFT_595212 [Schizopora paradoxa]
MLSVDLQDLQEHRNAIAVVLSPLIATAVWKITGSLVRNHFVKKYTVTKDLCDAGKARPDQKRIRGTAVICGGSIAGLWSARVCADHFEDVVIVEPEAWLATDDGVSPIYDENGNEIKNAAKFPRTRVVQYHGLHYLQFFTLKALRHFFPNFDSELRKRDGRIGEANCGIGTCMGDFYRSPNVSYSKGDCPEIFFCSREGYERLLRHLVVESSNRIRRVAGTVTALNKEGSGKTRVKNVSVSQPDGDNLEIPAALVVDCTGVAQAGFKWVKKLDAGNNDASAKTYDHLVESYDVHSRWKNYLFTIPPEMRKKLPIPGGYDNVGMFWAFFPFPGRERRHIAFDRLEGHRIRLSFYGWGNPEVPETAEDVNDFLKTLDTDRPVPTWIYELVDQLLEVKENMVSYGGSKLPGLNWIHFERADFVPANFVAVGDSVMRVNPSFGQGCTKAVVGAIALDSLLRSGSMKNRQDIPGNFSSKFFKLHYNKIVDAWDGTKPMDYMFDTTTPTKGEQLSDEKTNGELSLLLLELCTKDPEIDSIAIHIRQFLAPATDVFTPWVLWRIAKFAVQKKFGFA